MSGDVNPAGALPSLRQVQIAQTEQRILAAATELFLADGYVATTLEAVAKRAQVGARTVYLRFGTKAALFKRVVDVAIVGDSEPVDVLGRDWMQAAMTAPTAAERIAASAAAGRQIMERTGALFAVAQQAAAVEPLIAEQWQQGREQTRYAHAVFWTRMADDGLLDTRARPGLADRHDHHHVRRRDLPADHASHRLEPRHLPGLARDDRSSPGRDRGREILTAPATVSMCSDLRLLYRKPLPAWRNGPICVGRITNRDSLETFP